MNAVPTNIDDERRTFRQQVQERVASGKMAEALALCESGLDRARRIGDQNFTDQVLTARATILINRGEGKPAIPELRRLLMRSADLSVRFSAAYSIAHYYRLAGDPSKRHFYAKQTVRYSEEWGDQEARSRAHNLMGNHFVLDSHFEEAAREYFKAFELQHPSDSLDRAILLSNLGYCRVVVKAMSRGYRDLTTSLRMMRRLDAEAWMHLPLMGLSFACLEVGRPERALRHAAKALEYSERSEDMASVKNALYLLGESQKQVGRTSGAYESFSTLQRRFYPDNPMVLDVLMATDVRHMINLMA